MSRRKRRGDDPAAIPPPPARRLPWADGCAAFVAVAICLLLTWSSRWVLNPDGVSYLDLARLAHDGDWPGFLQGYWSPLYPALIGLFSGPTHDDPGALVALAHWISGVAAVGAIALLWWWGKECGRRHFALMAIAAFLLASSGLPRIEAVTPDVLLLALSAWVGYEFLQHRDERPWWSGVALGLTFLAKTSTWPLLIVTIPLRLWSAEGRSGRLKVAGSVGITLLIAALWLVPLSVKAGHPTAGSAGALNYDWYLAGSDARTPDTHTGRHLAYRQVAVDSAQRIRVVDLHGAERWTYAPWSDPTAWAAGIEGPRASRPVPIEVLKYWARQAGRTFGIWMLPLLMCVILPAMLRAASLRWPGIAPGDRSVVTTALIGLAGIGQFVLVHAEPRLIAPFVLLVGLAALHHLSRPDRDARPVAPFRERLALGITVLGTLAWADLRFEGPRVLAPPSVDAIAPPRTPGTGWTEGRFGRVVVVGPAMPVVAAAFFARAHIVAQLPPAAMIEDGRLSPDDMARFLGDAFGDLDALAWITDEVSHITPVAIPSREPPPGSAGSQGGP